MVNYSGSVLDSVLESTTHTAIIVHFNAVSEQQIQLFLVVPPQRDRPTEVSKYSYIDNRRKRTYMSSINVWHCMHSHVCVLKAEYY